MSQLKYLCYSLHLQRTHILQFLCSIYCYRRLPTTKRQEMIQTDRWRWIWFSLEKPLTSTHRYFLEKYDEHWLIVAEIFFFDYSCKSKKSIPTMVSNVVTNSKHCHSSQITTDSQIYPPTPPSVLLLLIEIESLSIEQLVLLYISLSLDLIAFESGKAKVDTKHTFGVILNCSWTVLCPIVEDKSYNNGGALLSCAI